MPSSKGNDFPDASRPRQNPLNLSGPKGKKKQVPAALGGRLRPDTLLGRREKNSLNEHARKGFHDQRVTGVPREKWEGKERPCSEKKGVSTGAGEGGRRGSACTQGASPLPKKRTRRKAPVHGNDDRGGGREQHSVRTDHEKKSPLKRLFLRNFL